MTEAITDRVKLGIPGLSVPQGSHLCGFFRGRKERDDLVLPFLFEGLRCGDKCLWAVDRADLDGLHVGANSVISAALADDQLDVVLSSDVYFGRGEFSVAGMLHYWDAWVASALAGEGFLVARAVGEMTSAVIDAMGASNLLRYESELNRFAPRYRQVLLCLYDLEQIRGDLLIDIMKTHPKVLMSSAVLENLYFVPPDQWASTHR